jgi:tetratricopeptide (TPR) repeat protein
MLSSFPWRRISILASLLFIFSFSLFSSASAQDLKKARALAAQKKYKESISEYLALVKKEPRNATLAFELGRTYGEAGKLDDAIGNLQKAVQLDTFALAPREELGKIYEKAGQYENAVEAYKGATRHSLRRFDLYKKIGDILKFNLGRDFDSYGYYKIVLAAAPNSKEAKEIRESLGGKKEEVVLVETLKPRAILGVNGAFSDSYSNYTPDERAVSFLKAVKTPTVIEVFLGTWCPDSEKHVPKMIGLLEKVANPLINARYIGVDRKMTTPSGREKGRNITKVPTFIVYQGDKEIGRIVETPKTTLENDLVEILRRAK